MDASGDSAQIGGLCWHAPPNEPASLGLRAAARHDF